MQISTYSYTGIIPSTISFENLADHFLNTTSRVHTELENHAFVKKLTKGDLTVQEYGQHLANLTVIYQALEEGIKNSCHLHAGLKSIYFPYLERYQSLQEDLQSESFQYFTFEPSQAAKDYVSHLKFLAETRPILLIAHAYVRYLGDLSGGMFIKRYIAKKWPDAVHFYDFTELLRETEHISILRFKEIYRKRMNSIVVNSDDHSALIQESIKGFEYAKNLFDCILDKNAIEISSPDSFYLFSNCTIV